MCGGMERKWLVLHMETDLRFMTWGESHGEALGVVVDGCPAGLELCEEDIQKLLDRRKPGQSKFTTPCQRS